jgi:Tfp pilus assembly protein PilW
MKKARKQFIAPLPRDQGTLKESGFALAEFLISTVIVLSLSAGVFTMLTNVLSTSGYQTEVLSVMENTRVAMSTIERYIVQAGNNPLSAAFTPVTITSATQVQLCSDLTGSAGGNQGDADGDISDANENVIIQYNATARTIELVSPPGTTAQPLAQYISGFALEYLDKNGSATTVGANVRTIRITINGTSAVANPRTRKTFGLTLIGVATLPNRG